MDFYYEGEYDFVVVGGGTAGICAAIQAARLGLKVALINNRPVLGGNSSSELRIPTDGELFRNKYPKIGSIMREIDNGFAGVCNGYQYIENLSLFGKNICRLYWRRVFGTVIWCRSFVRT